jgi:hypothetical protein
MGRSALTVASDKIRKTQKEYNIINIKYNITVIIVANINGNINKNRSILVSVS